MHRTRKSDASPGAPFPEVKVRDGIPDSKMQAWQKQAVAFSLQTVAHQLIDEATAEIAVLAQSRDHRALPISAVRPVQQVGLGADLSCSQPNQP